MDTALALPAARYEALADLLDSLPTQNPDAPELALYGGSFTALDWSWIERFLSLANAAKQAGKISRIRCSTRPDALESGMAEALVALGLDLVEVGIQSFDAAVLERANRGHGPDAALTACESLRQAGLPFVLHLMLGLPGQSKTVFRRDMALALAQNPMALRLHPTLVLAGTPLDDLYRAGDYAPLCLKAALPLVAWALDQAWAHGVDVVRVGLSPEPALVEAICAGPWHPALGQRAASLALYLTLRQAFHKAGLSRAELRYPKRYESDVHGWRGEMRPRYARLGITNMSAWDKDDFGLFPASGGSRKIP
jgi:histone acetyltransferase (RNA polymerase elongator complex component)